MRAPGVMESRGGGSTTNGGGSTGAYILWLTARRVRTTPVRVEKRAGAEERGVTAALHDESRWVDSESAREEDSDRG
jgi:hypothetical protein